MYISFEKIVRVGDREIPVPCTIDTPLREILERAARIVHAEEIEARRHNYPMSELV